MTKAKIKEIALLVQEEFKNIYANSNWAKVL